MALSRPCSQNDDLEEDAVPDLPTVKRSTSLNKGIQDTRYPKEYDFVLFYLFEDGDGAQLFYDELIGYGLKGCFYDDKSILPSSILLNHSIEVHEYACECSTYYILYVSQNLCKAMKLFSVHEDRVFKHAKYAALCKSLKTYKNHFVPFYPTLKREMKDIPFALGPLAGLEAKSRFYKKHLCALFGLVTVDNYITLQVDENHAAQQKKEDRRKKHAEEEKMKQSLPDSFEDDFRLSLGIGKAEEKHGEQPSNQANPSEDVNACSLPSGKPQTSPDGSLAPILAANEKPVYPKLEDLDQMVTNQTTLDANDGRQREEGNLTVGGARNTAAPTDLSGGKKEQSTERPVSSGGVEESLSPSIECRNNDAEGGNQAPQTSSNDHANGESTTSLTLSSDGGVNVGNSAPPPPGDDCVVVDGPVQAPVGNDGCERKDSSSNTPVVGHDQHVKASIDGESAQPTMPGTDGIEVDRPVQAPIENDGGERKDSSSNTPVVGHDQHVKASIDGESAPPTMPGADGIEVDRPVQAPVENDGGERKDASSNTPVVGHDQHVKASIDGESVPPTMPGADGIEVDRPVQAPVENDGGERKDASSNTPVVGHDQHVKASIDGESAPPTMPGADGIEVDRPVQAPVENDGCERKDSSSNTPVVGHDQHVKASIDGESAPPTMPGADGIEVDRPVQAPVGNDGCERKDASSNTPVVGHDQHVKASIDGESAPPTMPGADGIEVDRPVQAPVENDGCERKDSSSNTPVVGHDQHVKASIDGESAPPTMPGADGIEVDRPVQAPVGNDGGERKDSSSVAPVVGHDIGGGDQHVKASCDVGHDQVSTKTGEDLYHQKVEKQVRQPPDGASLSDQIDPPIKWNISQVKKLAPGGSDYQVGYVEAFMGPRHGSFQFGLPKLLGDPPLPRASSKQPQPSITAPHSSEVPRSNGGQHRPEQASDGAGNTTNTSQMQTNVFNISNTIIHHTQLIHQPASQPQAQPQINITMQPDSNLNMQVGDSNTIDQSTNEGTEEEVEYVRE